MASSLDENYIKEVFDHQKLPFQEYDNCTFENCEFKGTNLSAITFLECTFKDCYFESVLSNQMSFQDVEFIDCKMVGFDFSILNTFMFTARFIGTNLSWSNFKNFNLENQVFVNCNLEDVNFTNTNLTRAIFDGCSLKNSIFSNTNLNKADLSKAFSYKIHPEENSIKEAKFSLSGISGLLEVYDIKIVN